MAPQYSGGRVTSWMQEGRRRTSRLARAVFYRAMVAGGAGFDRQVACVPTGWRTPPVWVRIPEIRYATDVRTWARLPLGFIQDGDWDVDFVGRRLSIFEEPYQGCVKEMTHRTIRQLFVEEVDVRECEQYRYMEEQARRGRYELTYGCQNEEEIDQYFARLLAAYSSMRRHGYKTQRELGGQGDEIRLLVTRDGEWCLGNGGNHRIRMAELLGLECVPIVVAAVHEGWARRCVATYGKDVLGAVTTWVRTQGARNEAD